MVNYPRFCSDLYRRIRNMPRQYSPEFRQRALRLLDTMMETSEVSEFEAIKSVASKLGVAEESVRRWRRIAQVDAGERVGTTSAEHAERACQMVCVSPVNGRIAGRDIRQGHGYGTGRGGLHCGDGRGASGVGGGR
ncbi:MAG: hypothetical protein EKK51_17670 [Mycolicibacterium sp.]|uniref:transposase n=1 Tax=Mycolicibacterium sp. TaxID=2320850 RepID=UPI000F92AB9F|nr:MAG: hypothetical protein EKK51_17670 [Mycolicibacterium sp.]